jgi:hypothetical protein
MPNTDTNPEPPAKRHCSADSGNIQDPPSSSITVLERLSNATYHGMANLTYRIFHMLHRKTNLECTDVAQKVVDWVHQNNTLHKRKQYVVRPCNRRTGNLQMVYTRLPPDDPIHQTIITWILQSYHINRPDTSGSMYLTEHSSCPDLLAFDPLSVWVRFQKVFPVMAIYKSQWVATSSIAEASVYVWNNQLWVGSAKDLHQDMGWPNEIDIMCIVQLAQRLYPEHQWTERLLDVDGTVHCHMESIGYLRRAACVLHGFLLGPKASCTNVWEAISMPNRSTSHLL